MKTGENKVNDWNNLLVNIGLLCLSVLFFALPQPNPLSLKGFPFFAYIAFIPLFLLVRRVSFRASFIWGGLYGMLSYCVFTYWLGVFHPLALYVIATLYFMYLLLTLPVLKLADSLFPEYGYIVQWLTWCGYEYLKTLGFNGYSYGVIGYSQWSWTPIIQVASVFGVWGVTALVSFPSAWIAAGIKSKAIGPIRSWVSDFPRFARQHWIPPVLWVLALVGTLVFGSFSRVDYSSAPALRLALIQPNSDPWKGGINSYRRDFDTLTRLSDAALNEDPGIDLVVWPETAFIPRIDWHYRYREDQSSSELVLGLLKYLDSKRVPFILGNDDAIKTKPNEYGEDRIDYNAVFLFRPGLNVVPPTPEVYRKIHLVPFTEHFPYRKVLPWVYDLLVATDTHFWNEGTEYTVFEVDGLKFSTPVCFEDTFGYLSRNFVNNGARAIVNLTNDAWAHSEPCQYQHLSMAIFRAVENRVPLVRATASGQTCIVDPNGEILAMAEPFTETWLTGDIPVLPETGKTLYRIWGDLWGKFFALAAAIAIAGGLLRTFLISQDKEAGKVWRREKKF